MAAGIVTEAGILKGEIQQRGYPAARSMLALGALAAGIPLTFAWMGTLGWLLLRIAGVL